MKYPIEHGLIVDWDVMEKIWNHTFYNELRVDPKERAVLLTESQWNSAANRERMVQMMFEKFHTAALGIKSKPLCTLYAACRSTGVVLDCGHANSYALPIINNSEQVWLDFESFGSGRIHCCNALI